MLPKFLITQVPQPPSHCPAFLDTPEQSPERGGKKETGNKYLTVHLSVC